MRQERNGTERIQYEKTCSFPFPFSVVPHFYSLFPSCSLPVPFLASLSYCLAMDSPENAAQFLKSLETLIALFEDQASSPLSGWQKRQLHAWNALLKENGPVKRSRTRTHVRMHARKTAFKVKKTAGSETVLLFMLRYSISGCPKITYHGFYQELHEWSCRTNFPKLLKEEASRIWEEPSPSTRHALPNQQVPLHYEHVRPSQQSTVCLGTMSWILGSNMIPGTCRVSRHKTWAPEWVINIRNIN
jgi:hypothetical protein